jgi:hypothetical protein
MWCVRFDHWISRANASEMYLKKQSYPAILCNILDLEFNESIDYGDFVYEFVLILYAIHLECCKQLEKVNHQ